MIKDITQENKPLDASFANIITRIIFGNLALWIGVPLCVASSQPVKINSELDGVRSKYSDVILKKIKNLSLVNLSGKDVSPIRCLETPDNPFYIGLEQALKIDAPLSQVDAVLADINQYQNLFPGYKKVEIVSQDNNRLLTAWEQRVPLFFVPNVKYEMEYVTDHSQPHQVIYRYQLHRAGTLKASDGMILIQKADDQHTHYYELDYFDAEWGAAKVMGAKKIWSDSVQGMLHSDLAIKVKAEHTDFSNEKARDEAKKMIQRQWIEECVQHKKMET